MEGKAHDTAPLPAAVADAMVAAMHTLPSRAPAGDARHHVRYTDHMDRRITLETPSGRRYGLTPRTRRERVKTLRNR
jgi:hypothetical protein